MKNFVLLFAIGTLFISNSSFPDVTCKSDEYPNLSWNFLSKGQTVEFKSANVTFADGSVSEAALEIQQIYEDPGEFKARASYDEQPVHFKTSVSGRDGEYLVYTGVLEFREKLSVVTCTQDIP